MLNYFNNVRTLHTSYSEQLPQDGEENIEFEKYTQPIVVKDGCIGCNTQFNQTNDGRSNTHLPGGEIGLDLRNFIEEESYGMQDIQENLKPNHPYASLSNYRASPVLTKESEMFLWDKQFKRESIGEEVSQTFGPAQKMFGPSKNFTATPPGKNNEVFINSISRKTNFSKEMNKNQADTSLSSYSSSGSSYYNSDTSLSDDHKDMLVESYEMKIKSMMEEVPQSFNNGQMMYGPPKNWTGPPPGEGTEIFISKLPRKIDIEKVDKNPLGV